MEDWLNTLLVYEVTETSLSAALERLFDIFGDVLDTFWLPVQAAAAIYIAMIGYALLTGMISLSARDVAIRFAKVIGIIFLMRTFSIYGADLFERVWAIPDSIGDYFARQIAPILDFPGVSSIATLDSLAALYSGVAEIVSNQVSQSKPENVSSKWGFWTWLITMVPLALTIISIFIAKFVAAMLFLASPVVFILSLTLGSIKGTNILMSWFKALAMTFLTVIFVYIVGITCMAMMARYMAALIAFDVGTSFIEGLGLTGAFGAKYTLVHLAPLGIMAVFTIVLLSQATNVAGSLLSIAAINTQQLTSFAQVGALQAASKVQ